MRQAGDGLAIVLVTHNSSADLARNLDGHATTAAALNVPLLAVDNASTDSTLDRLRDCTARPLTILERERNEGYARAVNAAAAAVPGRDILLVNPDVALDGPEPVMALRRRLERDPRVGLVAPALEYPGGERQPSARNYPSLRSMMASLPSFRDRPWARARYGAFVAPSAAGGEVPVDWVIGAAMLIRREAFDDVGGWDAGFFLYLEDADFCRRLWRAGWEVRFAPEVSMVHDYRRASTGAGATWRSSLARRRHLRSFARFWRKHPKLLLGGDR